MTIIATVVIVPNAVDEFDALEKAEATLEISALDPFGEGDLNEFGRWESFAPGWLDYAMPVNVKTKVEAEALQVKNLDIQDFFLDFEDEQDSFIPEALVLADGAWSDAETIETGIDWPVYFVEAIEDLPQEAWIVFVEADC